MSSRRMAAVVAFATLGAEVAVALYSWIATAVDPDTSLRSLLGSDGIRWITGSFAANILSPWLAWMIMAGMATGVMRASRLHHAVARWRGLSDFERRSLVVVAWELAAVAALVAVLTLVPHAILLSAVGTLFPSSFSAFVVPLVCITVGIAAVSYGCMTGRMRSAFDVFDATVGGLASAAPWLVDYMLVAGLWSSLRYVGIVC